MARSNNKNKNKTKTKPSQKTNSKQKTYRGKIDITQSGIGYIITDEFPIDIKVQTKNLGGSLPYDEVEFILLQKNTKGKARQMGKVVNVLSRGQKFYT